MKPESFASLAERVEQIDTRRPERLAEVHAGIRRARRQRIAGTAVGAAALALAAVAAGILIQSSPDSLHGPVNQPDQSTPTTVDTRHLNDVNAPVSLEPGAYQFSVLSSPAARVPEAVIEVPSGFDEGASWYIATPDEDEFLGLWTVDQVEVDACLRTNDDSVDAGRTVEDLASVLVAQRSTRATTPLPVELDGYDGLYLELTGPSSLSKCDKYPALWRQPNERGIYSSGSVDMLWILDVDGQRVVVNAAYSSQNSTRAQVGGLRAMVRSMTFIAPRG